MAAEVDYLTSVNSCAVGFSLASDYVPDNTVYGIPGGSRHAWGNLRQAAANERLSVICKSCVSPLFLEVCMMTWEIERERELVICMSECTRLFVQGQQ